MVPAARRQPSAQGHTQARGTQCNNRPVKDPTPVACDQTRKSRNHNLRKWHTVGDREVMGAIPVLHRQLLNSCLECTCSSIGASLVACALLLRVGPVPPSSPPLSISSTSAFVTRPAYTSLPFNDKAVHSFHVTPCTMRGVMTFVLSGGCTWIRPPEGAQTPSALPGKSTGPSATCGRPRGRETNNGLVKAETDDGGSSLQRGRRQLCLLPQPTCSELCSPLPCILAFSLSFLSL